MQPGPFSLFSDGNLTNVHGPGSIQLNVLTLATTGRFQSLLQTV
jgi:hypothetical protein